MMERKKLKKRIGFLAVFVGAIVLIFILGRTFWGAPPALYSLNIGLPTQPTSALLAIAYSKGFFAQNGIDAQIIKYPSGKLAVEALQRGEVGMVSANQTPIVFGHFNDQNHKIIASITASDDILRILARSDRGILLPKDLIGKKIAIQERSASEFFLNLFLLRYQIPREKVTRVHYDPDKMPAAIANGEVDAIVIREPFIRQAAESLKGKTIVFSEPSLYTINEALIIADSVLEKYPGLAKQVLEALIEAEKFAIASAGKAIKISSALLSISESDMAELWPGLHLRVSLDQQLVYALSEESLWVAGLLNKMPLSRADILKCIDDRPLSELDRERVTLIR